MNKLSLQITKKSNDSSLNHHTLPNPSQEQLNIITQITNNNNVIIDSVFGSGKTTTILHIASKLSHLKILCFTYSKYLKEETRNKLSIHHISNLEIHSFHSFAVQYYNENAFNDIIYIKKHSCMAKRTIPHYDLVIIDEIQDMTPDLFEFIAYINHDLSPSKQFVLIGDQYQCIFKFKNADPRYLILAPKLFISPYPWIQCKLLTSFRVTHQIASFINQQLIGYNRVNAIKSGSPVNYILLNSFQQIDNILFLILQYLSSGYKPDDIFILSPSIKSNNNFFPLNTLENKLVDHKIPVITQQNDSEQKMSQKDMIGKIAFCTFHAVKGLERKICLVFSFDHSYFQFYNRDESPNICPATLYVACSRSIEHLTVIHSHTAEYLRFLKPNLLRNNPNINFVDFNDIKVKEPYISNTKNIQVTSLISFLPDQLVDKLIDSISFSVQVPAHSVINTKTSITINGLSENVSALYGTAIPFIKELSSSVTINRTLDTIIDKMEYNMMNKYLSRLHLIKSDLLNGTKNYKDLMFLTNCFMFLKSGYLNQLEQINNYDWVDAAAIEEGIRRLDIYIDNNNLFEIPNSRDILDVNISGQPDCIDHFNKIIWEFKFVSDLSKEFLLQIIVYAWIMKLDLNEWQFLLFNIKNGEIIRINKINDINQIITDLVTEKYYKQRSVIDDVTFINTSKLSHDNKIRDHIKACKAKGTIACI